MTKKEAIDLMFEGKKVYQELFPTIFHYISPLGEFICATETSGSCRVNLNNTPYNGWYLYQKKDYLNGKT